jgi:hypothetical protein
MYALKNILNDFAKEYRILMTPMTDTTEQDVPKAFKHFVKKRIYDIDPYNYDLFKCEMHIKQDKESGQLKISVLPHNLYSLVYLSIGSKPDISKMKGWHDQMNLDPVKYDAWTFYFDKKDQPIAINKNLGRSVDSINKFNL